MVGGLFGMNVKIPGQDNDTMFLAVVIGVACVSVLYCVVIVVFQTKKKQRIA